jgi:hypothetical protein
MHEVVKALRIVRSNAKVFIEIERSGFGEVKAGAFVKRNEFFIHSERSAAGGEAEDDGRIYTNGAGDDAGGFLSDFFSVLFENYEHLCVSPSDFTKRINGNAG